MDCTLSLYYNTDMIQSLWYSRLPFSLVLEISNWILSAGNLNCDG